MNPTKKKASPKQATQSTDKSAPTRNQLVEDHLHLVKYVVNRMAVSLPPGMGRDDLLSIGCWGLIDSAEKFDTSKGVLFKTYAITRIRGAILDELRRHSLGGQTLCRKARALEKAVRLVESRYEGKKAPDSEVAKELEITIEKLRHLYTEVAHSFLVSLDEYTYSDDDSESYVDGLKDEKMPEPAEAMEALELKETIMTHIDSIPQQEKLVLTLYYYEELTFKEIGRVLNVSESRVSQIHTKAIVRMRGRLKHSVTY
ncbi:MAG: FliA/WhiG family RNA polymerase sigma factor [bacterium]|nr:FliA/WhiG family RNA polymerase sigma factor [bacterium]